MPKSSRSSLPSLRSQVAALPVRQGSDGSPRVLLITARKTGRWIIPKGWPIKGLAPHEAAAREAFEEAGILGAIDPAPLGTYVYRKRQKTGFELCEVTVYLLNFEQQRKAWPEKGQRQLAWFSVHEAALRVDHSGLSTLIRSWAAHFACAESV